ncbi:hypothetical protein MUP05_09900 [Candidatus Bathyarchaeota archaeon]|nr:hypothetical protein [Candidatus Bathyarchaeota archaeon]
MTNSSNTVLIRGLDRQVYNKLVGRAKELGKNVADLVNEAMRGYVDELSNRSEEPIDPKRIIISGGPVTLSKSDIMGIFGEVGQFRVDNTGELVFDADVDKEAFQRIQRIHNTGKLRVPKAVHYLALLKAGHIGGTIEKY